MKKTTNIIALTSKMFREGKQLLSVCFMVLFGTVLSTAQQSDLTREVTQDEAFSLVQKDFIGQDVDYYILADSTAIDWNIFVDAHPLQGWMHNCFVFEISKTCILNSTPQVKSKNLQVPPNADYRPLLVKNRYLNRESIAPAANRTMSLDFVRPGGQPQYADRTYAMIISGGINKMSNAERYWNDCSFIYQTLVDRYNIPKKNIYTMMSDGNNPGNDMLLLDGTTVSQSLDLDFDGIADIEHNATEESIRSVFGEITNLIKPEDHLFIYVIDHGGYNYVYDEDDVYRVNPPDTLSYVSLWNGFSDKDFDPFLEDILDADNRLHACELVELLTPIVYEKGANINIVMGQCFSGGFIEPLSQLDNCVIATACAKDELSGACTDKKYDEFVYRWTSAINGATPEGVPVMSDVDGNGRVTMQETFQYALENDLLFKRGFEHPQYVSHPAYLGEDLAFNYIPQTIDLYIKDNPEDSGKEYNTTTDKFWQSPSIWIRNEYDHIEKHENPIVSAEDSTAYIFVKVQNRGKDEYYEEDFNYYLYVYWAKASTTFTANDWLGKTLDENGNAIGGLVSMTPLNISTIAPGESEIACVTWNLPKNLYASDNGTEKHHYCILAEIKRHPNGVTPFPGEVSYEINDGLSPETDSNARFNARNRNDVATKNVSIISRTDLLKPTSVYVRNTANTTKEYSLELQPRTSADSAIYAKAKIEMELAPTVYSAWNNGGRRCVAIKPSTLNPKVVEFTAANSRLDAIKLNANEFDKVSLKFNFTQPAMLPKTYTFDLVQRDSEGNIVGGETFIVSEPRQLQLGDTTGIIIKPINPGGGLQLSTNQPDAASTLWLDGDEEIVSKDASINVKPNLNNNSYSVVTLNDEGELNRSSVSLDALVGIKSATVNNSQLEIEFNGKALENTHITIASMTNPTAATITQQVESGATRQTVDVTALPSGLCAISYFVDDILVDTYKFNK